MEAHTDNLTHRRRTWILLVMGLLLFAGLGVDVGSLTQADASQASVRNSVGAISSQPDKPKSVTASCWMQMTLPAGQYASGILMGLAARIPDDVWAVGYNNISDRQTTLSEHWDGQTWTVVPNPILATSSRLNDVAFVTSNDVWAVGSTDATAHTLIEHWDGTTWSIVTSPNPGASTNSLYGVAALSTSDIWAVGENEAAGETLVEHWNGTEWSVVAAPGTEGTNYLQDIAALSANDIWIVGYSPMPRFTSQAISLHWNGSVWSRVPVPNAGSVRTELEAVTTVAPNDVWAVGTYSNDTETQSTLTLHWDGQTWSVVSSPNEAPGTNFLLGVTAISANDIWAVGSAFSGIDSIFSIHWDGQAWSMVTSPFGHIAVALKDVAALATGNVIAVGAYDNDSHVLAMHYTDTCSPLTATRTPIPPTPTRTPGLPSVTPYPPVVSCSITNVVASQNIAPNPNALNDVEVVAPNDVWAVGSFGDPILFPNYFSGVLIMHWDGTQWSVSLTASYGTGSVLHGIKAFSPNDIWAVGYVVDETLALHWDGVQWTRIASPAGYNPLYDVDGVASNDVWAVGGGQYTYTMHWNGSAWSTVGSPNIIRGYDGFEQNVFFHLAVLGANNVWAVGYGGAPLHPDVMSDSAWVVRWDGTQWAGLYGGGLSTGHYSHFNGISAVNANDIWLVGYTRYNNATNALTVHWNGSTFTAVPNISGQASLQDVQALAINDVYAIGSVAPNYEQPLTIHWDGAAWSQVNSPQSGHFAAIMGLSATSLWTVGSGTNQNSLTLRWDGTQWGQVSSPNVQSGYNTLTGVRVLSTNDIWAVGYIGPFTPDYAPRQPTKLIEHWDGAQWSIVPGPTLTGGGGSHLRALDTLASNDIWAVGDQHISDNPNIASGDSLVIHWDGSAWSVVPVPDEPGFRSLPLSGVAAISPSDVWAVGSTTSNPNTDSSVARMLHWNGTQWSLDLSLQEVGISSHLTGISALASNDIWVAGFLLPDYQSPYETLTAHWDGAQWTRVTSPSIGTNNNRLRAIKAIAPDDVWAVGYGGPPGAGQALAIHWDGVQWRIVQTPAVGDSSYFIGVDASGANDVWAVGNYFSGGTPHTLAERWTGVRWELVTTPNPSTASNYINGVASSGPGAIVGVGEYGYESARLTLVENVTAGFSDIPADNTFYPYVQCLSGRGIISGYDDCTFRPNNNVTRGQLSKIVSNSAAFNDDPGPQLFEDVPIGSTFYDWVNRLANRGYISGYPCGGPGETCGSTNLPYFRPNANATRGQISKIVSNAAGYTDTPTSQTFEDVPSSNTFYLWIERLASRGIMGGYSCGGQGEPCGVESRPYFRWGNNATRGQTSKIVANTFFPDCQAVVR